VGNRKASLEEEEVYLKKQIFPYSFSVFSSEAGGEISYR